MIKFLISILVFAFILMSCSRFDSNVKSDKNLSFETPEAKKFVLGKWLYKRVLPNSEALPWLKKENEYIEKRKLPILHLTFRDDNILVFENCMNEKCEGTELVYKICVQMETSGKKAF